MSTLKLQNHAQQEMEREIKGSLQIAFGKLLLHRGHYVQLLSNS